MARKVLFIPINEIEKHLGTNTRQDIKVVAPSLLSEELYDFMTKKGKFLKHEEPLKGDTWEHSAQSEANQLCEASDFADDALPQYVKGPLAISFVNERATQDKHYHARHMELYYSEHSMIAEYQITRGSPYETVELDKGGLILFAPGVFHLVKLTGLNVVIEMPAVDNDRFEEKK